MQSNPSLLNPLIAALPRDRRPHGWWGGGRDEPKTLGVVCRHSDITHIKGIVSRFLIPSPATECTKRGFVRWSDWRVAMRRPRRRPRFPLTAALISWFISAAAGSTGHSSPVLVKRRFVERRVFWGIYVGESVSHHCLFYSFGPLDCSDGTFCA